jgi:hypothetical protein
MKFQHKNPHTFDMSNYYSGMTYVLGGRDFEQEEKESDKKEIVKKDDKTYSTELDWSFLKSFGKTRTAK